MEPNSNLTQSKQTHQQFIRFHADVQRAQTSPGEQSENQNQRKQKRSVRVQEWKQTTNRQELKEIKTQRGAETVQEGIHKVEPRRGALQENGQAAESVGSSGGGDL